jgi:hypothetical protein
MDYVNPRFDIEWEEAMRYSEFRQVGKTEWIRIAQQGKVLDWSALREVGNVDTNLDNLEVDKRKRAEEAIAKGIVELPIVGRWPNGTMDLIGGNTRIAALLNEGYDPKVWVVNVSYATS